MWFKNESDVCSQFPVIDRFLVTLWRSVCQAAVIWTKIGL
jgi:hypothetical protein